MIRTFLTSFECVSHVGRRNELRSAVDSSTANADIVAVDAWGLSAVATVIKVNTAFFDKEKKEKSVEAVFPGNVVVWCGEGIRNVLKRSVERGGVLLITDVPSFVCFIFLVFNRLFLVFCFCEHALEQRRIIGAVHR